MTRFSRPVSAGSTAACWPARPITRRTLSGRATASMPATCREPPSGRSSVATERTNVVLPAPLGPSTAVTAPAGATRSRPSRAATSPNCLRRPVATMAGCATMAGGRCVRSWIHRAPSKWSSPGHFGWEDVGMRADRLVATLLVLQARGRVTAAEVAEELEVSVKTARRDLEALAMAGIPVYSQAGKGGGWSLIGGARTDLSGLTAAEARTLFIVAGPSSTATPEAKAALRKLVQALPETFRADAEAAASAVVLDPAGWGGSTTPRPPHLDELQEAVVEGRQVRLGYADRTRAETERTVHPLGPRREGHGLVPRRRHRQRDAHVPPQPGALGRDHRRSRRAPARLRPRRELALGGRDDRGAAHRRPRPSCASIRRWCPGCVRSSPPASPCSARLDDGRLEVEVGAARPGMIAEQLAGWGGLLEVVGPDEVRDPPRPHRPRARRALPGLTRISTVPACSP